MENAAYGGEAERDGKRAAENEPHAASSPEKPLDNYTYATLLMNT